MPTQTKTNPIIETVEAAAERVVELSEKAVANGKKASESYLSSYEKAVANASESYVSSYEKAVANGKKASEGYLSSYEKAVVAFADSLERASGASEIEWVSSLGSLQADATREFARAYTSAAREFVS
jgi:hypothetical protein